MGRKSRAKREYRQIVASFTPPVPSRLADMRWGLGWGLGYSVFFSLIVIIAAAVRGSIQFEPYGVNLWQVMLSYLVAGIGGGAAVGALRRQASQSRMRARWVGAIAGVIVYGSVGVVLFGFRPVAIPIALVLGVPMGFFVTSRMQRNGMFVPMKNSLLHPELQERVREHQRALKIGRRA